MKLIIEDKDYSTTGLKTGEYDLDDLGALRGCKIVGGPAGMPNSVRIDMRLDRSMSPEPGSVGEPHFKVGVVVERDPMRRETTITAFGRPTKGQAYGSRRGISEKAVKDDDKDEARRLAREAVDDVVRELTKMLVAQAVSEIMGPPSKQSVFLARERQSEQDKFFGLKPKTSTKCDECAGSGEWTNPADGATSPCSKGCPKR